MASVLMASLNIHHEWGQSPFAICSSAAAQSTAILPTLKLLEERTATSKFFLVATLLLFTAFFLLGSHVCEMIIVAGTTRIQAPLMFKILTFRIHTTVIIKTSCSGGIHDIMHTSLSILIKEELVHAAK